MTIEALSGLRVLDFTQGVAGPYATKLLSDYGADVVKVERPDRGDVARSLGPFPHDEPHPERSGMFLELNSGKRSVTLNLQTLSGRRIAEALVERSDLVIESFRPGTLARLGLSPERIEELQPSAVLVQVSNFGQDGPYRDFELDDLLAYAMGGVLSVTGSGDREPLRIGLYAPLFLAGGVIAAYALAAAWGAHLSGLGDRLDASITEILATSMDRGGPNLVAYQYSGEVMFKRAGGSRRSAVPTGIYACLDGYVSVSGGAHWWPRFCRTIGRPDLIDNPDFAEHLFDVSLYMETDALFQEWLNRTPKLEAMQRGQSEGYAISALQTPADVFSDPQFREREFFVTPEQPMAGAVKLPGVPFRMPDSPGHVRPAPTLGQHTSEVLGELGYSRDEIVILFQRGVV